MLLDANVLLLLVRTHFPLDSEVERVRPGTRIVVPSSVVDELDRLVARGVRGARTAAALARRYPVVPVEGRGDRAIVEAATRRRAGVVTADRALADRLRAQGLPVLVPRDRNRLELRPGRPRDAASLPAPPLAESGRRRQRL